MHGVADPEGTGEGAKAAYDTAVEALQKQLLVEGIDVDKDENE